MIDPVTIDKIINAAQILDVVSDFVTLKKRGVNYIGLCPFHEERTPSFSVSPAKGICKCFSCGKGGNAVNFIMEHEQMSYYEALKYLAKKYNIEVVEKELTPEEIAQRNDRESMLAVNKFAQQYFSSLLFDSSEGRNIGLAYFHERGFHDDIIRKFQLGYSLDQRDAFTVSALSKAYKKEYLIKTGLSIDRENGSLYDRFWGRVMFPVHSLSGNIVAFGGRVLKKDDKTAKYVNSPESEIYHKSNELYGIYFAKQTIVKFDRCFLVEGYTDVLAMHQAGIENVVASSGTSLTKGQIRLIHRFTNNVTVLYDGDAAGIKASIRGIDMLLEEGLNIKVVLLPQGEDPDSFAKSQDASQFISYIEKHQTDFIRFKTSLLLNEAGNDPIKRAALIGDIVRSIAIIPDHIIRSVYVKECSTLLETDEKLLYAEITKYQNGHTFQQPDNGTTTVTSLSVVNSGSETDEKKYQPHDWDEVERNIIQYMIRYGERKLFLSRDNASDTQLISISVMQYLIDELQNDHLAFAHPLHAKILREFEEHLHDEFFVPEPYFLQHHDPTISSLSADLVADKYVLSRLYTQNATTERDDEWLSEAVPRVLFEYKNKIVMTSLKEKMLALKHANELHDALAEQRLMEEISQLNAIKAQLAKNLGERIILKL
ncbi:DNA primase [Microbacter margulisiae]|uniref:DNA primase n=1 Tax=Microbacter margulisiae TaxID=1350067 RepID=A0A7W5DSF8_9PORP|nr:DNA primase [Microbacter margulisiae]MBB3188212.1 DNA primase [Microbacter margulisiae]